MRAMVCHRLTHDRSGLAFEPAWPEPLLAAAGEVTVALSHAALNYPDLLMLSGGYQFLPPLPFVPGVEGAGTVIAVGPGVDPALLGRDVIVGARNGLFAERITVPTTAVRRRPPALAPPAAAAFTVAALTAYVALVRRGRLVAGERVAVAGAGGRHRPRRRDAGQSARGDGRRAGVDAGQARCGDRRRGRPCAPRAARHSTGRSSSGRRCVRSGRRQTDHAVAGRPAARWALSRHRLRRRASPHRPSIRSRPPRSS